MAKSDKSDIMCLSIDNVQIHVHRPNRCVMTASTFTNEVGLVSYRLDVACENQQVYSKRKPKSVTRIDNITLRELRERWEVFCLETTKTVVVDRTLHKSGVATALPDSLTADQSWEVRETVDDKQVQELDNIERYDLLVNDAVDGGIETSECRLPSSREKPSRHEPHTESVAAVNVSHSLDVACENQQVFSRQKPKSVTRIDNITLRELRERWEVFYLETVKTVVVSRTLHKSVVATALPDSLTADQEAGHSVEADYSQPLSDSDISDLSKLHVSTKNDTATATGVCTDAQAAETDSGLSSLTVISMDDQKMTDYDQLQEHKKVQLSDLSRNDNRLDDSGIQTSYRGMPLSAEESVLNDHHQPVALEKPLWPSDSETGMDKPGDEQTGVDTVDMQTSHDDRLDTEPHDNKTHVHRVVTQPGENRLGSCLSGVDRVDTRLDNDDNRLVTEPWDDETGVDRVVTQPGDDDRLVTDRPGDETGVDKVVTQPGDDDRLVTEPRYDETGMDKVVTQPGDHDRLVTEPRYDETGVDKVVTLPGDDDRLVTEPRYDETGVDRVVTQPGDHDRLVTERPGDEAGVDMVVIQPGDHDRLVTECPGDETGVDRVVTQPGDDDRLDTEPRYDETGVDRVVTQPGDDDRLVTEPRYDETGVDRVVTQPGDDDRLDTEPRYDETGVDKVVTLPSDDDRLVTERRYDEIGVDRVVTQPGDDDRLVTEPRYDETGVDRVFTRPGDHDRLVTERPGDETGVDRVVTQPGDDDRLVTEPRYDETGVDMVVTRPSDDDRLVTEPRYDETGVDKVFTRPGDDDRLHTEPRYDETGVDKVVTRPGDDDRLVTEPRYDETGVDKVVTQPGDDDRLVTEPRYDETGVDRVVTQSGDDDRLVTEPRYDETGVDMVVTRPSDDDRLVTEPRYDETGVDKVFTPPGDDDRLVTEPRYDETGVDKVVTQPGDDVLMSESDERVIHTVSKLALEDISVATETSSRSLPSGMTAEAVEVEHTAPEEYTHLVEIREVSSSEMSKDHIRKPVAAVDATSFKLSEPEALSEFEHEDGRSETAATGPSESLAITVSDDVVVHQKPLSEVHVFSVCHSDCMHIFFVNCIALLLASQKLSVCMCVCM